MKIAILLLFCIYLSSCFAEDASKSSIINKNPNEISLTECSMGFVTTGPCAVKQSGVVVSLDFGSDVLLWTNPTATTSITAAIPNGFYANHNVLFSEPNMIPINIKSGVSIFGVSGTLSNDSCVAALALAGATSATGVSATNATINWVAVGASSLALTGLSSNTTYKFRVKAISSQGLTDCNTVDLSVTTASQTIPTDLTNLSIWLKAEDLSGNTDGTPVSTWVDSSTNSRDFTGAGAVRRVGVAAGAASARAGFSRLARRLCVAGTLSRGWSKISQGDFSAVGGLAGAGVVADAGGVV